MIDVVHQHPGWRFSVKDTVRTVGLVLRRESAGPLQVSVVFTNDLYMKRIHGRYLGDRSTTDVMAFPLSDGLGVDGEVYVNLDQARRQAGEYRVPVAEEVRRLVIHGTLHLLGYRDSTPRLKAAMRRKEDQYLNILKRAD